MYSRSFTFSCLSFHPAKPRCVNTANLVSDELNASEKQAIARQAMGTGGLDIYDINNNAITGAAFLGTVGLDWRVIGFGDFSSRNEADMLLRNVNTGGLEALRH